MRLTLLAFLLATFVASAENETREIFRSTPDKSLTVAQLNLFSVSTGELDENGATQLVTSLLSPPKGTVFIIHTLVWRDVSAGQSGLAIDKQHWYILETGNPRWGDDDFAKNNRLFGDRKVWFLYVHLNVPADAAYTVNYTLHATHKMPAYLVHLGQVLGVALTPAAKPAAGTNSFWDAHQFTGIPVPSDMDMSGAVSSAGAAAVTIDQQKFDNEGRYHVDFSIGVPIVKLSELSYVSASNTLVPAKVEREKLFGLFNYYFQPVDIKASGFSWVPHAVAGVALGSRPLQKSLIGVGWGPTLANFYFGLLLNTQRLPQNSACGDGLPAPLPAGTVLKNKTCPQFGFGLNISAGSILDTLKKK